MSFRKIPVSVFSACKKHSCTGYPKLIHLAFKHDALRGFVPDEHLNEVLCKPRKKKVVAASVKSGTKKCLNCLNNFSARGVAMHRLHCKAKNNLAKKKVIFHVGKDFDEGAQIS
jgi:hypothetical protein